MHTSLIHIDTANPTSYTSFKYPTTTQVSINPATQQYSSNTVVNPSFLQPVLVQNNGNPFDFEYFLQKNHTGIRKVSLESAEIPVGFNNIRAPFNTFKIDSTTFTVTPGQYLTQTSYIAALNTAVSGTYTNPFSSNATTNTIQFIQTSLGSHTFTTHNSDGSPNVLAFAGFTDQQTARVIVAPNTLQLYPDTYICIYISTLKSSTEPNLITYKIPTQMAPNPPLRYTIQYTANNEFYQEIDNTDTTTRYTRFHVNVFDRWGYQLDNNQVDWSFTLKITSV